MEGGDDEGAPWRPRRSYLPTSKSLENVVNNYNLKIDNSFYPIRTPKNEKEAMQSEQREEWLEAMHAEMIEIWNMHTYELVPRPPHTRIIPSRFVCEIKWKPIGENKESKFEVQRFKARWVAQGYNLHKGIDYTNAYAFTLNADSDS